MAKTKEPHGSLYAHTKTGSDHSEDWQTLEEHLKETACLASGRDPNMDWDETSDSLNRQYADRFGSSSWGFAAGILHDLGKAAPEFQDYLKESANKSKDAIFRSPINHSEAGAAWAESNLGPFIGRTLAYLIAGHHAGLPDYEGDGLASLRNRLENGKKHLNAIRDRIGPLVDLVRPTELTPPNRFQITEKNYHLWVRMLFSCLVDADRLNTEAFDSPEKGALRPVFPTMAELKGRFEQYMNGFVKPDMNGVSEAAAVLNRARNDVYSACVTKGREGKGRIFTLTVPTGGGKTLSSMAFGLNHAVAHNKRRIIYVIPYTSITEQTATEFRKVFGAGSVIEHHSNFDSEKYERERREAAESRASRTGDEDPITAGQMEMAAENWDAPIIVTTNVQFFESLFSAAAKRCRKLHNIVDSVVILDEAQLLRPEFLAPCVDVMNQLAESFGVTLAVCTATQPTLDRLQEIKKGYSGLTDPQRIIPEEMEKGLYRDLSRIEYVIDPADRKRTWKELAAELSEYDEVLCVVNTRCACYSLFQELRRYESGERNDAELSDTVHLSALMCGEHRSRVIDKIKKRLETNQEREKKGERKMPIRVVSTQLIEAGVNIDFPILYRARAGLDSIAQAAGRCNREGRLGHSGGKVIVFNPPEPSPPGILLKGESATKEMLIAHSDLDLNSPEAYSDYFQLFYKSVNHLDEKNVIKSLTQNVNNEDQNPEVPFRTIGEIFRLIDDDFTVPVIVRYCESEELIRRLEVEGVHRELMRKIGRFTVNLSKLGKNGLFEMMNDGKIREIYPGIFVQQMPGLYDVTRGFDIYAETMPNEASII